MHLQTFATTTSSWRISQDYYDPSTKSWNQPTKQHPTTQRTANRNLRSLVPLVPPRTHNFPPFTVAIAEERFVGKGSICIQLLGLGLGRWSTSGARSNHRFGFSLRNGDISGFRMKFGVVAMFLKAFGPGVPWCGWGGFQFLTSSSILRHRTYLLQEVWKVSRNVPDPQELQNTLKT